jgi:hypothetical protein
MQPFKVEVSTQKGKFSWQIITVLSTQFANCQLQMTKNAAILWCYGHSTTPIKSQPLIAIDG